MQNVSTVLESGWEVAQRLPPGQDIWLPDGGEEIWLPAHVPGHVHQDLVRAGILADPFHRLGEIGARWVDEADWSYRTTFFVSDERFVARGRGRHYLVFHGIDTFARIFLNGQPIGTAENFFVDHRFDVTDTLRPGENHLRVEIDSALRVGRERAAAYLGDGKSERGAMHYFNFSPRAFVRKPQYMFGWDWGPSLISAGLWRPVELLTVPLAQIVDWRIDYTFGEADTVDLRLRLTVEKYDDTALLVGAALFAAGETTPSQLLAAGPGRHTVEMKIERFPAQRWQIHGSGKPRRRYLLNLKLALPGGEDDAETIALRGVGVGFRTIELVREPDDDGAGESFRFRVNGEDVYIKGANWIPDHALPAAVSRARLRERLTQARDAGFNMLRVWGGGLYETDEFYELCDELGLLVWQDFPFACSTYPDDLDAFVDAVHAEATAAVRRLRHRCCLALWCGGNENLELHQGRWAGKAQAKRFFGERIIHEVLPTVLAAEDPHTPYWPNSPYGDAGEGNCQNESFGDAHYWNVWHAKTPDSDGDWINYLRCDCRFSSEFGFAAPAGPAAWASCTLPADRAVRSLASRWHDKTRKGYETYLGFIGKHFPAPQNFEDLIYYGQANQAMALSFGIEHWRRRKGRCWGTLFWQLNDCWPTHSWAVIDSAGEPKLGYYAVKRAYAPLLLSLSRTGRRVEAHLVSDLAERIGGLLVLRLLTFEGEEVSREEREAFALANAASGPIAWLDLPSFLADNGTDVFVHGAFVGGDGALLAESFLTLAEPKDLRLSDPGLSLTVHPASGRTPGEADLEIAVRRFAAFVTLRIEGLEKQPSLSDNGFHLAPGEARTLRISHLPREVGLDELPARLRLRHL